MILRCKEIKMDTNNHKLNQRDNANEKKRSNDILLVISILIGCLSLLSDVLTKMSLINSIIFVSENYIFYVFSLIFTVATLCCTLLSIIVSVNNNRVLGLQIKEIVSLKASPVHLKTIISFSLIVVILSIPALSFELFSFMTILAVCLVIFLLINTLRLFRIIFDSEYSATIINKSVVECRDFKQSYVMNWISSLNKALIENDTESECTYLNLLRLSSEKDTEIHNLVEKHIVNSFELSCKYQPFVDSIVKVLRLNGRTEPLFDERSILYNYTNALKYVSPLEINRINLPGTIEEIVMNEIISDYYKPAYCMWLIRSVIENSNTKEADKLDVLYRSFSVLCNLSDSYGNGDLRSTIIICIFKYEILLLDDYEFAKKIYSVLLKALYVSNPYSNDKCFVKTIAQIIRMVYFWGYLEKETLSESKRHNISALLLCPASTTDNAVLTIGFIVTRHSDGIVEYLVSDAFDTTFGIDSLDYSPDIIGFKSVVCTRENKIRFSFWLYSITGYRFSVLPIKDHILVDSKEHIIVSKELCAAVIDEFNPDNTLTEYAKNNIENLKKVLGINSSMPLQYLVATHDAANTEIQSINIIDNTALAESDSSVIRALVESKTTDSPEIELDGTIDLDNAQTYRLPDIICSKNYDYSSIAASGIQSSLTQIVNYQISKRLRTVKLSFDLKGVKTLYGELAKGTYLWRNYTYYDDWGLNGSVRQSDDYNALKKKVDEIPISVNNNIHNHIFLFEDGIKFNYKIIEINVSPLTEEMIDNFLNQCRIADGQYKIDNGIWTTQKAKEYIANSRYFISAKAKVEVNIHSDSGFKVDFSY